MKVKMLVLAAALSIAAVANAMSLAEARGKISKVIENPAEMTSVMKQLSAADQKTFVAEVNAAISQLPGTVEERSALIVNVDTAAIKGAAKGNVPAVIAEVFATAPAESLTVLNETLGKDVLNRSADPKVTYTDAQMVDISKKVVTIVNERVAGAKDAGVRAGFAALMMIRASNGSPSTLANDLADMLGDSAEVAKTEWFPAATASEANYDSMIAETEAEKAPDVQVTLLISGPQQQTALLSAIAGGSTTPVVTSNPGFGDQSQVQTIDHGVFTLPRTTDPTKPWNPDVPRGYDGQKNGAEN